jgi:Flp pilus assembly protein CpaB
MPIQLSSPPAGPTTARGGWTPEPRPVSGAQPGLPPPLLTGLLPGGTSEPPDAASRVHPSEDARRRRARRRARRLLVARYRPVIVAVGVAVLLLAVLRVLAPAATPTQAVLVAVRDLPAGHALEAGDLRQVDWPAELGPPPGRWLSAADLLGRELAAAVRAGEVLSDTRLVGPGLLAGQPPGTLAVPIRLADTAAAGIVAVGDRVDVLAGAGPDATGFDAGPARTGVVASDVLVLAIPGRDAAQGGGLGALTGDVGGESESPAAGLLVVAADRSTAVSLAGAQAARVLSVAVRGPPI